MPTLFGTLLGKGGPFLRINDLGRGDDIFIWPGSGTAHARAEVEKETERPAPPTRTASAALTSQCSTVTASAGVQLTLPCQELAGLGRTWAGRASRKLQRAHAKKKKTHPSHPSQSPHPPHTPSLLQSIHSKNTGVHKSISFEDFSLGTAQDAEDTLSPKAKAGEDGAQAPVTPAAVPAMHQKQDARTTWSSVFNPGRNNNPAAASPGNDQYDHTHEPGDDSRSVWEEVIKAERVKSFASLDKDQDGYISAGDLKAALGPGVDVDQMIQAADKNRDGKVDFADFSELLRNS